MWRFAGADDRESLENASMDTTDDDGKKREQPWYICPKTFDLKKCDMTDTKEGKKTRDDAVVPDAIINRQKNTKTKKYIYEVKWQHKGMDSCRNRSLNQEWKRHSEILVLMQRPEVIHRFSHC